MGAMLGYDAELVAALDAAMRRGLIELDAVRCTDEAAASAMQSVRRCRAMLRDTWLSFTAGLLACSAMDGFRPVVLDADDLLGRWAAALVTHPGWQLRTDRADPLDGGFVDAALTTEQARTLAVLLSGAAGHARLDSAALGWLAGVLGRIAADARLTSTFLNAFTTGGWTDLCNRLGRQRQLAVTAARLYDGRITAEESDGWADIDATFAALGAMVAGDHERNPLSKPTLLLEDMTPMAAALLAQHLELDAVTLANLTRSLVARERLVNYTTPETQLGERAADVLFASLERTPGAPTAYVLATLDDPSLLLEVAFDPAIGVRVATVGTDPVNMSKDEAASTVPGLMRWFLDASRNASSMSYNPALAVGAADVLAPYLLPMLRSTDDGWGLSRRTRRAIEDLLMGDDDAFAHLLGERDRIVRGLTEPLPGSAHSLITALSDIADLLAFIDTMRRARTIRRAEDEQAEWDLMWTLIGYGQNLLRLQPVASVAVSALVGVLHKGLDELGLGPPEVGKVRAGSLAEFDRLTTVAAAILVATGFDEMVATHRIAAGTPPPPIPNLRSGGGAEVGAGYTEAFEQWLDTSGVEDGVAIELFAIKNAIASRHETTGDANEALLED